MNFLKRCMIQPGQTVDLSRIDPNETFGWKEKDARKRTAENLERIASYQDILYAEQKHSLLLCLQAMDTGGKDGTVKVIAGAMNPAGVRVVSFKKPTPEERAHDFLWRIEKQVPQKPGEVVVFNRSQYEDVGIVRVHSLVPETEWRKRYDIINDFEKRVSAPSAAIPGGTHILKFFLHISPEEQLGRLKDRLNEPDKHWKLSESDFQERPFWNDYMQAYGEAISRCTTDDAPWIVIPANHKWMRDLIISEIVADTMKGLKLKYPEPSVDAATIRQRYFTPDGKLRTEFDVAAKPGKPEPSAPNPAPGTPRLDP
jgi:PPK2 family polyphosphate:nucleotide phosphotransferase